MADETHQLRKLLIASFMTKKCDRIQQKIQQKIDASFKDWETILGDYINVTTKLNNLVRLTEQHNQVCSLRLMLTQCTELIQVFGEQFEVICHLIDTILPMSNLSTSWMDNLGTQNARLGHMKDAMLHVERFSCNRDVIDVVRKMVHQVSEIQNKINFATRKVHDIMYDSVKGSSASLNNAAGMMPSFADNTGADSISMISNESVIERKV